MFKKPKPTGKGGPRGDDRRCAIDAAAAAEANRRPDYIAPRKPANKPALMLGEALRLNGEHDWSLFPARMEGGKKYSWLSKEHAPGHENWGMTRDPKQLKANFFKVRNKRHGIGVPTGIINNIFVVEADTVKGHGVDGLASLRVLQLQHDALPDTLMAESPSGSVHYYFKHPGAQLKVKSSVSEIAPGVDVKGDGGMVIAPPSKRDGGVYRWLNDSEIANAPPWLLDLVTATATDASASNGSGNGRVDKNDPFYQFASMRKPSLAEIEAALIAYANTKNIDRKQWVDIGHSIKSVYQDDDGRALFLEWSATWPFYDERKHKAYTIDTWDGFKPDGRITIGTLFYLADQTTPGWREAYQHAEAQPEPNEKAETKTDTQADDGERTAHGYHWKLNWHGDIAIEDSRPFLIQNVLPESGYGLMPGQWGTYKTFIALDMAGAVMAATKRDSIFIEYPVRRPGGVLFLACEGQSEMTIRLEAVVQEKCPGIDNAPFTWVSGSPRLLDPNAAKILTAMIKDTAKQMQERFGVPLVLVVIDTAGKAAGYTKTGEGNDDATAKIIQRACNAAALACNVFILGVDHFGKDTSVGTKGASGKEDDADTLLAVLGEKSVNGRVSNPRLCLRKRRGGENGVEYPFTTRVIDMGEDMYGSPMTTLVIEWTPPDVTASEPTNAWGKTKALRLLHTVLDVVTGGIKVWQVGNPDTQPPPQAIDLEIVRKEFYARYIADGETDKKKQDAKRKAFHRVIGEAQDAGVLASRECANGVTVVWALKD